MKHIIIINHICFYDCENLFRHLHKWSCQNDKPPDSEATCQRVRRYVRVVEHVHASIARSSARSLRIWLPGDSSADYHLDSIFIGAKIIVLLVIFTYITKLYNVYIYISLYKYRSFHIDICIYPPQKKKKKHLLVISQVGLSQNGVPLIAMWIIRGYTPFKNTPKDRIKYQIPIWTWCHHQYSIKLPLI